MYSINIIKKLRINFTLHNFQGKKHHASLNTQTFIKIFRSLIYLTDQPLQPFHQFFLNYRTINQPIKKKSLASHSARKKNTHHRLFKKRKPNSIERGERNSVNDRCERRRRKKRALGDNIIHYREAG